MKIVFQIAITVLFVISAFGSIAMIGAERKPLVAGDAIATIILAGLLIAYIWIY